MTTASSWDVIGIGANSIDLVYLLPAFPQPEGWLSKMRIARQLTSCGGQTATALATCARFGLKAKYIGVVGTDENGDRVRRELPACGVDTRDLVTRDGRNQCAVILIDQRTGERGILWDRDESLRLSETDLGLDVISTTRLLHVDDVDQSLAIRAARVARGRGIPVTSDFDRMTEMTDELVMSVSSVILADGLHEQLTGEQDHERALRKLRRRHDGLLCVTVGHRGAVALDGDRFIVSPGFKVRAVDTTGSGDVFRGGFICGTLNAWDTERTLQFANAAAALACTRLGAIAGVPTLDEVLAFERTGERAE
jgi:sulfofructose kinase